MRKVIMFNMMTLDGYFEGEKKWDIEWHRTDQEFNEFSIEQLKNTGGIIFGKTTYEGMASYWQSPSAFESDPVVAELMNALPKFVFSKTLEKAEWNNSFLLNGDAAKELIEIKRQPGGDLFIFGSAELSSTFIMNGLIDEFRLMVNPIVLGRGKPLFKEIGGNLELKLKDVRTFNNGNVLLSYIPDGQ